VLFSFTGLGKSEGLFSEIDLFDQKDDLKSIINFVRNEKPDAQICLAGISLGGTTSILAYMQNVESGYNDIKVLLIWNSSLQTNRLFARYKDHYMNSNNMIKDHELYIMGEHLNSGRKMWESFGKIDAVQELKKVTIPICALFGEEDEPEKSVSIRQILENMPNCSCEMLPGVDHELTLPGSQERVIKASLKWLKEHF
jgi:alpha-beta hydrolase superfamily lysophospholipase